MIKRVINVDVYERKVTVLLFEDSKSMDSKLNSIVEEDNDTPLNGEAYSATDGKELYMLFKKDSLNINTISHECMHITYWILSDACIELNDDTQEAYCYLLGMLVDKTCRALQKTYTKEV